MFEPFIKVKLNFVSISLILSCLIVSPFASASWFDKLNEIISGEEKASPAGGDGGQAIGALTNADLSEAFKQALDVGSEKVVQQLGQVDGFNRDQAVRIPLPTELATARKWMDKVGMGGTLDDLEVRLNRAAEQATPQARQLFVDAIQQMTFDDVRQIYNGPTDAATRYFESKMTPQLRDAMAPVVSQSLSDVGALNQYDDMISAYKSIPFVPDIKADLTAHVVSGGLDGIFHYLAEQEAAIRKDPVRQTTNLLRRVFGQQ